MKPNTYDRRAFLLRGARAACWAGLALGTGSLIGCGGDEKSGSGTASQDGTDTASKSKPSPASDPCSDVSGLTDDEIRDRAQANYVAVTTQPPKRCDNCEFWEPPEGDDPCGGCTVLSGPYHPGGYCDLWVIG